MKKKKKNRYSKSNYKKVAKNYMTQKFAEGGESIYGMYDAKMHSDAGIEETPAAKLGDLALAPFVSAGLMGEDSMQTRMGQNVAAMGSTGMEAFKHFQNIGTFGISGAIDKDRDKKMDQAQDQLGGMLGNFGMAKHGGEIPKYQMGAIANAAGSMLGGGGGFDMSSIMGMVNNAGGAEGIMGAAKGKIQDGISHLQGMGNTLMEGIPYIMQAGQEGPTGRGMLQEAEWELGEKRLMDRAARQMGMYGNPADALTVIDDEGVVKENAMQPGLQSDIRQAQAKTLGEQKTPIQNMANTIKAATEVGTDLNNQMFGKIWDKAGNVVTKAGNFVGGMFGMEDGGMVPKYQQGAEVGEEGMNQFRLTPHLEKEVNKAKGQENGVIPVTDQNPQGVADLTQQDGVYDLQGERHASPQNPNAEGIKTNAPAEGQGPSIIETEDGELAVVNQGETFIIPRKYRNDYLKLHNKRRKIVEEKLNNPEAVDMNPILKNTLEQVVKNIGKQEMALFNKIKEEKAAKEMKESQELTEMIKQGVPITPEGEYKKGGKVKSLSDHQKKQLSETYYIDLNEGMDSYQAGDEVSARMKEIARLNIEERNRRLAEEKRLKQERKDQRAFERQERKDERTTRKSLRKVGKRISAEEREERKREREEWKNLTPEQRRGRKAEEKYAEREARDFNRFKDRTSKDMQRDVRREEREAERLEKISKRNPERADRVAERMDKRENRRLEREIGRTAFDEDFSKAPVEKTPEELAAEEQQLKDMLGQVGNLMGENAARYDRFDRSATDRAVEEGFDAQDRINEEAMYEGPQEKLFQQNIGNQSIGELEKALALANANTEGDKRRIEAQIAAMRRNTRGSMGQNLAQNRANMGTLANSLIKLDQANQQTTLPLTRGISDLEYKQDILASEGQYDFYDRLLRNWDNYKTQQSKIQAGRTAQDQNLGMMDAQAKQNEILANALPDAIDPNTGKITMGEKPGSTTPTANPTASTKPRLPEPNPADYPKGVDDPAYKQARFNYTVQDFKLPPGAILNMSPDGSGFAYTYKEGGEIKPEEYFWGALVNAVPAVMGALGGGGGGGLLGGLLGGGGKKEEGGGLLGGLLEDGGQVPKNILASRLRSHMSEKETQDYLDNYRSGGMIKRADGSYSKRGLWDNIRANKGSGKKPTAEMLKQERKIKREEGKYRYGSKVSRYQLGTGVSPNFTVTEPPIPQDPSTIPQGGYSKPDGTSIGLDGQEDPIGTAMNKFKQTKVGGFMADNPELVQEGAGMIGNMMSSFGKKMMQPSDFSLTGKKAQQYKPFANSEIASALGLSPTKAKYDSVTKELRNLGDIQI